MARWLLRIATGAVLLFLYVPIVFIVLYSFNAERGQTWPITALDDRVVPPPPSATRGCARP